MALFHGVINSKALMKDTTLSMIVPSDDRKNIGFQGQPQLLILLHGAGGSNYTWSKYSSIERYTEPLNLIVLICFLRKTLAGCSAALGQSQCDRIEFFGNKGRNRSFAYDCHGQRRRHDPANRQRMAVQA